MLGLSAKASTLSHLKSTSCRQRYLITVTLGKRILCRLLASSKMSVVQILMHCCTIFAIRSSCSVKLQPLTVICNADVMTRLSEFFRPSRRSKFELKTANIERKLQNMLIARYKELKDSTKTEFIHSLDELMFGEVKVGVRMTSCSVARSQSLWSLLRVSPLGYL